ncbi:acyl-CoA dehydrogenase family protein [Amycolatopsis roodepoortensis]|uniref:Alkylation response protein AidB-like acyl-CoA dehydrogenase n=1 Tax=Amycolatopsis roodepoortensis TaxID=700274 RepID=A0ABR9LDX0_9PSEU|nr:acyl-CoA dehydrogenase family protein [Amycolatopsis roodepoortensis]MBE1578500.1 alkylation response protein AidB-like acyl-CoA dehydrogenase [Amycolatopsis roodepoortensis]
MTFTAEQDALRDSVRKLLDREADPWPELCEQIGVAALAVPERFGGLGAGTTELQVVAEELGRILADVPFLGSAVLAVHAVLATGNDEACERLLPRLAEGVVGAVAWTDAEGRWDAPACRADDSVVEGEAHYVLHGDEAEILLVVAGDSLYEVTDARRERTPAMDETRRLARVRFDGAPARLIGPVDLGALRDVACAVLAAEQAGAAARALELTVEYSKQRHQFGRPIGGFQALKHRMADLHVLVETARSAAYAAPESSRLAAVAKVHCSEALATVAGEMIQLHGGIAITWEHPAHRYFKRAHGAAHLFGSPGDHLGRVRPPLS